MYKNFRKEISVVLVFLLGASNFFNVDAISKIKTSKNSKFEKTISNDKTQESSSSDQPDQRLFSTSKFDRNKLLTKKSKSKFKSVFKSKLLCLALGVGSLN